MKLMRRLFSYLILLSVGLPALAQEKWDLKKCVEYAWEHNVLVKQAAITASFDSLTLRQNRLSQYPFASGSTNTGLQFGRSIDPTTNQFTNTQLLFQQYNFQTNITVFNWNNIRNSILAARYGAEASKMDIEKAKNDLALNVATGYLQALLAGEQVKVVAAQVAQTQSQLADTRKRVEAGSLPELNAVQLEAQLATDSSSLITAKANAIQSLLSLKAQLYLDAAAPFELDAPPVDMIPVDPIAELQPDFVYATALKSQPAQKSNELRIKSLEAASKASRALMYPTIGAFGGLNTRFSNPFKEVTGATLNGYFPTTGAITTVNGVNYPVLSPNYTFTQDNKSFGGLWHGWGSQLSNNFSQNIGLTINIPIFNSGSANINYQKSKLNLVNAKVSREAIDQTLKQNIYQAYNSATAALQKFNANQVTVTSAQKAYDFANKRYNLGLLGTYDLIISQTNLTKAKLDLVNSHYDYVFKMKVLEYYKGLGIRLQ